MDLKNIIECVNQSPLLEEGKNRESNFCMFGHSNNYVELLGFYELKISNDLEASFENIFK